MIDLNHVEWCRACRDEDRLTPAIVILWGRLFPPEALGPRCWDHAAEHADMSRIDQWAVFDLRPLVAELRAARHIIGPANAIYEDGTYDPVLFAELGVALAAYDKATGGK